MFSLALNADTHRIVKAETNKTVDGKHEQLRM